MSEVYFFKSNEIDKVRKVIPDLPGRIGVKAHFGEEGNTTYLPAEKVKELIRDIKDPTLVECSVLYRSQRSTAGGHEQVALKHGFDFAPLDFLDGPAGDDACDIPLDGKHFKHCFLGKGLENYDSLLVISHFKGHNTSGFGGAIKNLGMGLASRRGKLAQHSSIQHKVSENRCTACGTCVSHCPVEAISFADSGKAFIDEKICISCSKCIAVCPEQAIKIPWDGSGRLLCERMSEYAYAAAMNRRCYYVNFLVNITPDCDCMGFKMAPVTGDIGILASKDPVAIDQASFDMVVKQYPDFKKYDGTPMLAHAEEMGIGEREYKLVY